MNHVDGPAGSDVDRGRRERFGPRRLAERATARPRRVLATWALLALFGLVAIGGLLGSALTDKGAVTNNPESHQAKELIDSRLPGRTKVDEVVIVRSERAQVSDAAFAARVRSLVAEARRAGGIRSIRSYLGPGGALLVSRDRHATIVPVVLADPASDSVHDLIAIVQRSDGQGGFAVHITGEHTAGHDFSEVSASDLSTGELQFGLPAALIVLLLVFGTVVGASIPLLMAMISIVVGLGLVAIVGHVFKLNLFVTNMLVAMGLALGIDYSLFIVSRLREERARGADQRTAILTVASTATRAVVFSGTAFTLAMLGMLIVPHTILRSLAVGAIAVAIVSIAVALTFHPALLMALGDRVNKLKLPWLGERIARSAGTEGRFWGAAVRAVLRRPTLSLILAVALLLAAAAPLLGLKIGASGPSSLPDSTVAKQGLIALQRDFPTGATQPVNIVVDAAPNAPWVRPGLARLRGRLQSDPNFASRAAIVQSGPDIAVLSVPLTAEASTERATSAISRLRDQYVPSAFGGNADRVLIGGTAAENLDYFALIGNWLPIVITIVLALSLVLLTLAFRSIVVPLTAIAVNLLSVAAAYGLLVLVFQDGVGADVFGFGHVERIEAWVPIFLFSVLFGLSMDYQVFLLSRIQERYRQTGETHDGIVHGVASTARLITGAALIIIVVFAGFATGQLVSFQQMGFGVAVALLLDATIVRLVIIPAVMGMLGDRNWYLPRWLAWLPKVQVEGPPAAAPPTAGEPAPPPVPIP
ncbi:MAG: MMPL family transporter [Solirubrobacteraceae bacterium]